MLVSLKKRSLAKPLQAGRRSHVVKVQTWKYARICTYEKQQFRYVEWCLEREYEGCKVWLQFNEKKDQSPT